MHASLVVTRQEAAGGPLAPSVLGQCERHHKSLAGLGLYHRAVFVSFAVGMGIIGVLLSVARRVGLVGMTSLRPVDFLNVYVETTEQVLPEVVALWLTPGHELVADAPLVSDDQRYLATSRNPQRVWEERILIQRDFDS